MLAAGLSAVGSIAGMLGKGKGKGPTEVSGYTSLPGEQKDFASGPLWDKVMEYFGTGYEGIPKRRINEEDMDPTFGSKARQDLQGYFDTMAAMKAATPKAESTPSGSLSDINTFAQLASQKLTPTKNKMWQDILENPSGYDLGALTKAIQGGQMMGGGGPNAGMIIVDGKYVNPFQFRKQ